MNILKYLFLTCLALAIYACPSSTQSGKNTENSSEVSEIDYRYFDATGNEPFWHLQILGEQRLMFDFMGQEEINISMALEEIEVSKKNTTRYTVPLDSGQLIVTIEQKSCTDNMSGEKSPYTAHLQVKLPTDTVQLNGCGTYLGDYRLNDIWVLESINNETIPTGKAQPRVEFKLKGGKIRGFGTCNNFNGSVEITGDTLKIDHVAATLKACAEMEIEDKFFKSLGDKIFQYQISQGKLELNSQNHKLVFKKVD